MKLRSTRVRRLSFAAPAAFLWQSAIAAEAPTHAEDTLTGDWGGARPGQHPRHAGRDRVMTHDLRST